MSLLLLGGGGPGVLDPTVFDDDFSTDRLSEYTLASAAYSVAGGVLTIAALGAVTTGVVTAHNLVGGATSIAYAAPNLGYAAAIGGWLDALNFVYARYDGLNLGIFKRDLGLSTLLNSVSITPVAGDWMRLERSGNLLTASRHPGDPATTAAVESVSATLAGADATKFGAGIAGRMGAGNFTGSDVGVTRLRLETLP